MKYLAYSINSNNTTTVAPFVFSTMDDANDFAFTQLQTVFNEYVAKDINVKLNIEDKVVEVGNFKVQYFIVPAVEYESKPAYPEGYVLYQA